MTATVSPDRMRRSLTEGVWRLDPARSTVAFHVRHFYGLMTVKGQFARYEGTLDLSSDPAVKLTIDADSLDTGNRTRDKHLCSGEFFDVESHPQVRFLSENATLDGDTLTVVGGLYAAGKQIPLEVRAQLRDVGIDGEIEIEAEVLADHRKLGMLWSPLGIMRAPSRLIIRGRLVRQEGV